MVGEKVDEKMELGVVGLVLVVDVFVVGEMVDEKMELEVVGLLLVVGMKVVE